MNEQQLQQQTQTIHEADLERERAEAMASVSDRMQALQSIYIDISDHVSRASTQFTSIESHLIDTAGDTGEALREVKITAARHFQEYFRRMTFGAFLAMILLYTLFF